MSKAVTASFVSTFAVFAVPVSGALAAEQSVEKQVIVSPKFTVFGGVGYTWLKGNELVYSNGDRISHLKWESNAPVVNLGAKGNFYGPWTLSGNLQFGFSGNSKMRDYDWLGENYEFDNWTHRSVHPDTHLDRYINFDIAVGRAGCRTFERRREHGLSVSCSQCRLECCILIINGTI